jgi:hypothetical protein
LHTFISQSRARKNEYLLETLTIRRLESAKVMRGEASAASSCSAVTVSRESSSESEAAAASTAVHHVEQYVYYTLVPFIAGEPKGRPVRPFKKALLRALRESSAGKLTRVDATSHTAHTSSHTTEHILRILKIDSGVVALTLLGVGEGFVGLTKIYHHKLAIIPVPFLWYQLTLELLSRIRVVGVLIGMKLDRHFAVCLLDIRLGSILINTNDAVVVLPLALLELQLRVADLLLQGSVCGVGLSCRLELPNGLLPVTALSKGLGASLAGFGVGRIETESFVTVGDGF